MPKKKKKVVHKKKEGSGGNKAIAKVIIHNHAPTRRKTLTRGKTRMPLASDVIQRGGYPAFMIPHSVVDKQKQDTEISNLKYQIDNFQPRLLLPANTPTPRPPTHQQLLLSTPPHQPRSTISGATAILPAPHLPTLTFRSSSVPKQRSAPRTLDINDMKEKIKKEGLNTGNKSMVTHWLDKYVFNGSLNAKERNATLKAAAPLFNTQGLHRAKDQTIRNRVFESLDPTSVLNNPIVQQADKVVAKVKRETRQSARLTFPININ